MRGDTQACVVLLQLCSSLEQGDSALQEPMPFRGVGPQLWQEWKMC